MADDAESHALLGPRDRARISDSDAAASRGTHTDSATRPAAAAAATVSSSSAAAAAAPRPARSGGAPLLHLIIQRTDLPRLEVSVPSDWSMMQLRDLAYPPGGPAAADAVDPRSNAASAAAAASSSSSSSSSYPAAAGFAPVPPPSVPPAAPAANHPRELIVLYCGRRIPAARWSSSLAALGIRSQTSLHMLMQDVVPLPSYQANDAGVGAGAGADRDEYFDRSWDRHHREPLGSWLEFTLGLALGFLLGFLALLWLLQPRVSRRCRLGILTGLSCNLIVGISRLMQPRDEGEYSRHSGPTPAGAPSRSIAGNGGDMIYTTDDQGEPKWIPRSGPRLIGPTRASTAQRGGGG